MFCIDVFDIQNYIFTIEFLFVTYKLRVFVDGLIVVCLTYMTVLLFLWMSACHHAQRNCLPYQCVGHDSNSPFQTICIFITNNYIFYFWKKKCWVFFLKVNWILQHDAYLQLQTWATIFMVSFNQWSFKSMRIKCLLLKRGTEEEVIFKQLENRWEIEL